MTKCFRDVDLTQKQTTKAKFEQHYAYRHIIKGTYYVAKELVKKKKSPRTQEQKRLALFLELK